MATNNYSQAALSGLRMAFLKVNTIGDLAELLHIEPLKLTHIALHPAYSTFLVPKKNGNWRVIEDPDDRLQSVQAALNDFLQAVYWFQRSDVAYGFLVVPIGDPSPRHIESNARKHLGNPFLLNCDLKDFFHQLSIKKLKTLFSEPPFQMKEDLIHVLTHLCTYKGRCPMGAPTSPVLSNLAFYKTDIELIELSRKKGWTLSRYADDISVSSQLPINWADYSLIKKVTERNGFHFNPEKAVLFGPEDVKTVTGLVLGIHDIDLPDLFFPDLSEDIRQLAGAIAVQYRAAGKSNRANDRFCRSVEGRLRFAERILGDKHPGIENSWQKYRQAITPPLEAGAKSWLDFNY